MMMAGTQQEKEEAPEMKKTRTILRMLLFRKNWILLLLPSYRAIAK
jgi:hypothetical protein